MSNNPFDANDNTPQRSQFGRETIGDPNHEPPPRNEGEMLGEFVLEKLLGRGGSGFVYRALDTKAGSKAAFGDPRRCALKVLHIGSPETVVRNRLGFRGMMQVNHRNLVRVYRIHRLGDYTALAMEEVCGETLSKAIVRLKQLPRDQAFATLLSWMRDFAAGLAAMHVAGLIHRDIKPLNLMIDSDGRGRVIDYGLVEKFDIDGVTTQETNFILGTPRYWSPEILYSQKYLPAGDIFALGLVMLETVHYIDAHHDNDGGCHSGDKVQRDHADDVDAELLFSAIDELSDQVPELITETCREMLDRYPSERPTAIRIARLGLPPQPIGYLNAHEPLIGREDVLEQVRNWVDGVFSGRTERLHLSGPSGIGKTRVLDAVIEYIQSKHWGQVFRGRCRAREDAPLQAFEQICDSIANRYSRSDREPIELDPVSAEILWDVFPFLRKTIVGRMELPPPGSLTTRLDSLEAAARFSRQLRKVGPLFIVIDDTQWADQDSLNVMDRLQTTADEIGMGIITVARSTNDRQQIPPHVKIHLGPIADEQVRDCLNRAANTNQVRIDDQTLDELTVAVGGSPFRLQELTYEFRAGGALSQVHLDTVATDRHHRRMDELVGIKGLWQSRFDRLSDDAKQTLLYVVTAGGLVSTEQLGQLTGHGDDVDVAVSELSRLRLIIDDATGGECISIYHDRFADQITLTLTDQDKRRANAAWAALLTERSNDKPSAARIAGHWIAAGQPGRAVSHAILAAEEAERVFAHSEAARWHARVIDHLSGQERMHHIRQAARCYHEADLPVDAARHYSILAEMCDGDQRFDCELHAAVLMLRCGQYAMVRERLTRFAIELGLPRPKSPSLARANLLLQSVRSKRGRQDLLRSLLSLDDACNTTDSNTTDSNRARSEAAPLIDTAASNDTTVRQPFELCLALIRPLAMYDNLYAGELSMAASRLARQVGTISQRIHVAVGEAVFGTYNHGPARSESENILNRLVGIADRHGDSRARGDVRAGLAFAHLNAGRWVDVDESVGASIECYEQTRCSHRFEVAHVQWVGLWADWITGQWQRMSSRSESMFDEAIRRNDLFQQQMCTGGLGGNALLVRGRLNELKTLREKNASAVVMKPGEVVHFMHGLGMTQQAIYEADFQTAWQRQISCELDLSRLPLKSMQIFRVLSLATGALIGLHHLLEPNSMGRRGDCVARGHHPVGWESVIRSRTLALRHEQMPFACMIADLYDGLLNQHAYVRGGNEMYRRLASEQLQRAQVNAGALGLRPFRWAAGDAIAAAAAGAFDGDGNGAGDGDGGQDSQQSFFSSSGVLVDRLRASGVADPDRLARLYTVPAVTGGHNPLAPAESS